MFTKNCTEQNEETGYLKFVFNYNLNSASTVMIENLILKVTLNSCFRKFKAKEKLLCKKITAN